MKTKKFNWNYVLIAPALIISVCIILVPGIMTVIYSFTDWNGLSPEINFIGFRNFIELFHDKIFYKAITNNIIWTILFLTIPVCIGMLAAMLLLSRRRTRSIYQVAFLIPYVLAPSVNAMLWLNVIFSPVSGVISVLRNLGMDIGSPLANVKTAIYGCAAVDIWHYWSYLTVIYLAALRQTPTDQVEAARVEGCNGWQLFRYIYLPNIMSTVSLMFVMITIGSFLAFDYIKLMTGGGPAHATEVLGTYAYTFAFSSMKVGKAAACGLFISFFGLIASFIYARISRREERR
ncbi:sugar ABC transporter permease [Mediterraneibacter sp. NSJ-55]|uniref:Sugar ABC transporter permease n=1 Tax=Mediterraneibacter hominis TaxID=2763054 RepID=A0A923LLX9_9FIRM|nr:sugar ABC transporter permease [Mediterraneibacter hominis]MBC5690324.1 sugar ABC transporter permease [Mediterraneibacter hominis]